MQIETAIENKRKEEIEANKSTENKAGIASQGDKKSDQEKGKEKGSFTASFFDPTGGIINPDKVLVEGKKLEENSPTIQAELERRRALIESIIEEGRLALTKTLNIPEIQKITAVLDEARKAEQIIPDKADLILPHVPTSFGPSLANFDTSVRGSVNNQTDKEHGHNLSEKQEAKFVSRGQNGETIMHSAESASAFIEALDKHISALREALASKSGISTDLAAHGSVSEVDRLKATLEESRLGVDQLFRKGKEIHEQELGALAA